MRAPALLLFAGTALAATPAPTPAPKTYKCYTEGGCLEVAPGSTGATTKAVCEATCGKPTPAPAPTPVPPTTAAPATPKPTLPPVYACDPTKWSCDPVKAGTPGSSSLGVCQASCKVTPAPVPTPAPTAPPVYGCDAANATCGVVPAGTAGSASKSVCESVCGKTSPPAPPATPAPAAKVYKCAEASQTCEVVPGGTPGAGSLSQCSKTCKVAPSNCTAALDVLFVLDGSGSIAPDDWQIDLDATETVATRFDTFGCNRSAAQSFMGIVEFGSSVELVQQLTCSRGEFEKSLRSMAKPDGYTYTGDALEAANAEFAARGRSGVQKIVVVITDGVPCTDATVRTCNKQENPVPDPIQAKKAQDEAGALKALGVKIATVTVGDFGPNGLSFIHSISSAPLDRYVFNPTDWDQLPALLDLIIASICPAS